MKTIKPLYFALFIATAAWAGQAVAIEPRDCSQEAPTGSYWYCFNNNTTAKAEEVNANFKALREKIDTLNNKVTTLETAKTTLETKVTTLEADKTNLQSQIDSLNTTIAQQDTALTTLQTKVSVLENSGIHILAAGEHKILWTAQVGGPNTQSVSSLPNGAKGAILKVTLAANSAISPPSASFACADASGSFSPLGHTRQVGVSNYTTSTIGGLVFCPLKQDKTFVWKMASSQADPSTDVASYGTLIGWY